MLDPAERDLEQAFDHYDAARPGLGAEFVVEFRRAVDEVVSHPDRWPALDAVYRSCRLHRFPYGIVYRVDAQAGEIMIVAVMHLSRDPD